MLTLALHEAGDDAEIESAELRRPRKPSPSPQIASTRCRPPLGWPAMPPGALRWPSRPQRRAWLCPNMAPVAFNLWVGYHPKGHPRRNAWRPAHGAAGPPPMQGAGMPPVAHDGALASSARHRCLTAARHAADGWRRWACRADDADGRRRAAPILFNARIAKYTQRPPSAWKRSRPMTC